MSSAPKTSLSPSRGYAHQLSASSYEGDDEDVSSLVSRNPHHVAGVSPMRSGALARLTPGSRKGPDPAREDSALWGAKGGGGPGPPSPASASSRTDHFYEKSANKLEEVSHAELQPLSDPEGSLRTAIAKLQVGS